MLNKFRKIDIDYKVIGGFIRKSVNDLLNRKVQSVLNLTTSINLERNTRVSIVTQREEIALKNQVNDLLTRAISQASPELRMQSILSILNNEECRSLIIGQLGLAVEHIVSDYSMDPKYDYDTAAYKALETYTTKRNPNYNKNDYIGEEEERLPLDDRELVEQVANSFETLLKKDLERSGGNPSKIDRERPYIWQNPIDAFKGFFIGYIVNAARNRYTKEQGDKKGKRNYVEIDREMEEFEQLLSEQESRKSPEQRLTRQQFQQKLENYKKKITGEMTGIQTKSLDYSATGGEDEAEEMGDYLEDDKLIPEESILVKESLDKELSNIINRLAKYYNSNASARHLMFTLREFNTLRGLYERSDLDFPDAPPVVEAAEKRIEELRSQGAYLDEIDPSSIQELLTNTSVLGKQRKRELSSTRKGRDLEEFLDTYEGMRGQSWKLIDSLAQLVKYSGDVSSDIIKELNLGNLKPYLFAYLQDPKSSEGRAGKLLTRKFLDVINLLNLTEEMGLNIYSDPNEHGQQEKVGVTPSLNRLDAVSYFKKIVMEEAQYDPEVMPLVKQFVDNFGKPVEEIKHTVHQPLNDVITNLQAGAPLSVAEHILQTDYEGKSWSDLDDNELFEIADKVLNSYYRSYPRSLSGFYGLKPNEELNKQTPGYSPPGNTEQEIQYLRDLLMNRRKIARGEPVGKKSIFPNSKDYGFSAGKSQKKDVDPQINRDELSGDVTASIDVVRKLIRVANVLDHNNFHTEASLIDKIINKLC
jgi:hypothetical protein